MGELLREAIKITNWAQANPVEYGEICTDARAQLGITGITDRATSRRFTAMVAAKVKERMEG